MKILAMDIGTTFLKAAIVNEHGSFISLSRQRLNTFQSTIADPVSWLKAMKKAFEELDIANNDISCLIISGNGPTLCPSDGGNALLWTHSEAVQESALIKKIAGLDIAPSFYLPKAMFLKRTDHELYRKTRFFLSTPEYVSFVLTGVARTYMPLEGLDRWYWNSEILRILSLDENKFPPFIKAGEMLGTINQSAASEYGIKEGTPVLAGCPDFVGAIIGSGAMHEGQVCDRSGTGEGINFCSDIPNNNPQLMCYKHPNGMQWNISRTIKATGIRIQEWKHNSVFKNKTYDEMFAYASDNHDSEIFKICHEICLQINNGIEETSLGKAQVIHLAEGSSRSAFMAQLRANITGLPVKSVECSETGILGLCIIALSSFNKENIVGVSDRLVKISHTYTPGE